MRKSELSPRQQEMREHIIDTLTRAGWRESNLHQDFDRDQEIGYEANLQYQNETLDLMTTYFAADQTLAFGFWLWDGRGIDLILHIENLDDLLATIIAFQDAIAPDNYKRCIQQLQLVCPRIDVILNDGETTIPLLNPSDVEPDDR